MNNVLRCEKIDRHNCFDRTQSRITRTHVEYYVLNDPDILDYVLPRRSMEVMNDMGHVKNIYEFINYLGYKRK